MDITELKKQQARYLRSNGMSFVKIAKVTGLARGTARYACNDIPEVGEDNGLEERMNAGRACLFCGSDLPEQEGSGRRRKFCSEDCRRAYWKIHRQEGMKRAESMYVRVCEHCGKTFEVYGQVPRKYCSRNCYLLHRYGEK